MTIFFAAIALATIAVLAYTVRRQYQSSQAMHEHRMHLAEEVQVLRFQLRTVREVIDRSAGGVEKRIREHQQIVAAITGRQPVLFKDEPGLEHWLNANNEFFHALKATAASEHVLSDVVAESQARRFREFYSDFDAERIFDEKSNIVFPPS